MLHPSPGDKTPSSFTCSWKPLHPHPSFGSGGLCPAGAPSSCLLSCGEPATGGRKRHSCFVSIPMVCLAAILFQYQTGTGWDSWKEQGPKTITVHITLNPSSIIMLCLHPLLGLLDALPGLLQLLLERPQLQVVQPWTDAHLSQLPQDGTSSQGKSQEGLLRGLLPQAAKPSRCQFYRAGQGTLTLLSVMSLSCSASHASTAPGWTHGSAPPASSPPAAPCMPQTGCNSLWCPGLLCQLSSFLEGRRVVRKGWRNDRQSQSIQGQRDCAPFQKVWPHLFQRPCWVGPTSQRHPEGDRGTWQTTAGLEIVLPSRPALPPSPKGTRGILSPCLGPLGPALEPLKTVPHITVSNRYCSSSSVSPGN